jgi:RsiW-degrading membrane proteinase PrsW (M82 family)
MEQWWIWVLAIVPGPALAALVWWLDRYDREPRDLLIGCFLWGASITIPVGIVEVALASFYEPDTSQLLHAFIYAFFVVAAVEELAKYFVVRTYVYWRPDFDEPYDGITYTVMVAMGFATVENVMYVVAHGADMQLPIALVRMFTAIPAHAADAVLMGYFLGLAKFAGSPRPYHIAAIVAAIIAHGLYDLFIFYGSPSLLSLGAIVVLIVTVRLSVRAIRLHQELSPFRESRQ